MLKGKRVCVIGGVAGGASAATRLRRLDETANIILFERGADPSFANCGMPYYISGDIKERSALVVTKPEKFRNWYNIDIRPNSEVLSFDRSAKVLSVKNLQSGKEYKESYDKLVLSMGAKPLRPPIEGLKELENKHIFVLRNLEDMDRIHKHLERIAESNGSCVVVGGGYIGLEMAEGLRHRNIDTHLVELQSQVMPPLDAEMAVPVAKEMAQNGIHLHLGASATQFSAKDKDTVTVKLNNGQEINTNMVLLSVGVRPESELAAVAGLEISDRGGIVVDTHMRTSDPDVYAVGDVTEIVEYVSGKKTQIPLAGPANRQGRIAADNICGRSSTYRGTQGTSVLRVFGKTVCMTGLSEKLLQNFNIPYRKVFTHINSHAGYYPGAERMSIKLLFSPEDGKVLGAQIVGGMGADKRIDVLAMAIQGNMTVFDLEEAELAYAPMYGSAKDPINMIGFVAAGVMRGDQEVVQVEDALAAAKNEPETVILDVRQPSEYDAGHFPDASHIPLHELRDRLDELDKSKRYITYCRIGMRGYMAQRILKQNGFNAQNITGGYEALQTFYQ